MPDENDTNGSDRTPDNTTQQDQGNIRAQQDSDTDQAVQDTDERPPQFVTSRAGRYVSVYGLVERITAQFSDEYGNNTAQLSQQYDNAALRGMVRDVADYILSVESVRLGPDERAKLFRQAYGELFGFGPLDVLFSNPQITTIALEGTEKISVRYGPSAELTPLAPIFEDGFHLQRIIKRLLSHADAELRDDLPFIEVGLTYQQRPISISIVSPPLTLELTADLRLHPAQPVLLDDLLQAGTLTPKTAALLRALAASEHGVVIVGDTESGKTTLLSALAHHLPTPTQTIAVERAGELRLPEGAGRRVVRWSIDNAQTQRAGVSFAACITQAIDEAPACILLDEVRADEPDSVRTLLERDDTPRQIWSFRGPSDPKRLRSALGMVARRSNQGMPEAMVNRMYERLPFVVLLKRRRAGLGIREIAEWQYPAGADYPDWVTLLEKRGDTDNELAATGKRPKRALNLPHDFWE
jgi:Flp pilus assembly CpaF family ATPase